MAKVIVTRSGEWLKCAVELYELQNEIKMLKEMEKELMDKMVVLSENRDSKGDGFEFKRIDKVGAIKYSSIPELKFMDLEPYRGNPISYWKLHKKW